MDDWRITNQEKFLCGIELSEVKFPDFWEQSYLTKNDFYQMIKNEAENFVREYDRGKEFLKGEKVQKFWHAHCDFCTETITAEDSRVCYCNGDYTVWICRNCFEDFCQRFNFKLNKHTTK